MRRCSEANLRITVGSPSATSPRSLRATEGEKPPRGGFSPEGASSDRGEVAPEAKPLSLPLHLLSNPEQGLRSRIAHYTVSDLDECEALSSEREAPPEAGGGAGPSEARLGPGPSQAISVVALLCDSRSELPREGSTEVA